MMNLIDLAERRFIPDFLIRIGIRRLVAERLAEIETGDTTARAAALIRSLSQSEVALATDSANEQHYEVPAGFFAEVLGRHMKYSACLYPDGVNDLDAAEAAMLETYAERAELSDGQDVLDLGCGWGSFTLWAGARYPGSRFTAVSNSASQRRWIEAQALSRGLLNVRVITCDVNRLDFPVESFDRVVSIEMFEHVRNYAVLLERIQGWLRVDGALFVHIFCHRTHAYPYEDRGQGDWMARHFFTGGLMPAFDTLSHFNQHLHVDTSWPVSGSHYARTARDWLRRLDTNAVAATRALVASHGDQASLWLQRWRIFFMACEELFGWRGGQEWLVGHYRLKTVRRD